MIDPRKIEFDLKVRKYKDKNSDMPITKSKPDWEVYEELNFKSLSAKEVMRKLLDYIVD